MQYRFIVLFIFCTLILPAATLTGIAQMNQDDSNWYPFYFPAKLDPNSPLNIGKLILDTPAGKHGYVKVKNDHFYFEDGTRAKFWGTNLTFGANFPTKENAKLIADRLAFFGFNAVRLHHMDFFFEPNGIFEDQNPAFTDPQMKKTGHLSKKQLDRLDYFLYLLKQHGIYVDMNLLVSRHFTKADGVIEAEKLDMAAKPVSMFDPRLIELQKKYAQDLLTHINPYTKMRYSDDPVIALVEITNENSIIQSWHYNNLNGTIFGLKRNAIPEYYTRQLDQLWNSWLEKKYSTIENVKINWGLRTKILNMTETSALSNNLSPKTWIIEQLNGSSATLTNINGTAVIVVKKTTGTDWHLQYCATNVPLTKGKNYLLRFTTSANKPLTITAAAQQAFTPWKNLGLFEKVPLTPDPKIIQIPFTATMDCPNTKVGFIVGETLGKIILNNITLTEINNVPDITNENDLNNFQFSRPVFKFLFLYNPQEQEDIKKFYIDLEHTYVNSIKEFLNTTCGIKVPITGIGGYSQEDSVTAQMDMDFIDRHAYWDLPNFPHRSWDNQDFTMHNRSLIQDKNLGFINDLIKVGNAVKKNGKPFTITEWNHCYPNPYAYETPVLLAAQGRQHDWDGLFEFDFSGGWQVNPEFDDIQNYLNIIANPQKLILNSIASYLYLDTSSTESKIENEIFFLNSSQIIGATGKIKDHSFNLGPINVTTSHDGAIFLYSADKKSITEASRLILVTLGNVANTNSGWTNKTFRWGQGPTLLENIDTQIILDGNKTWKIYEVTPEGQLGKEIPITRKNGHPSFTTKNITTPWFELISADNS